MAFETTHDVFSERPGENAIILIMNLLVALFCPEETHAFLQCKPFQLDSFILILCCFSQKPFTRLSFYNNRFVQRSYRYQSGVHSKVDKNRFIHTRDFNRLCGVLLPVRDRRLSL